MTYSVSKYRDGAWVTVGVFDTITDAREYVETMVMLGETAYLIEVHDGGRH